MKLKVREEFASGRRIGMRMEKKLHCFESVVLQAFSIKKKLHVYYCM